MCGSDVSVSASLRLANSTARKLSRLMRNLFDTTSADNVRYADESARQSQLGLARERQTSTNGHGFLRRR